MGGGSQTTSSNNTTSPNPTAMAAYTNVLGGAQNIVNANQNWNPATGVRVADWTGAQGRALSQMEALQGGYGPQMAQAANLTAQAGQGITGQDIAQFQNPYTQSVIGATMANAQQQQGAQLQNVVGNQVAQNALGGDRAQLQKAMTEGQFALANNQTIAGLEQSGYSQALAAAQAQKGQELQAAYGMANMAQTGQNLGLAATAGLYGMGAQQQSQYQNVLNAATQNAQSQQMWPYQNYQWLANIVGGIGSLMGGNQIGYNTTEQHPGFANYLGMGLGGISAMSDERLKEGVERVGELYDGQPVFAFNYKGNPLRQIGLMAQDVEKRHPEATGEYAGFKTVDYGVATKSAAKKGHFADGGSVDPWGTAVADPWGEMLGHPMTIWQAQQQQQQAQQQAAAAPQSSGRGPLGGLFAAGGSASAGVRNAWGDLLDNPMQPRQPQQMQQPQAQPDPAAKKNPFAATFALGGAPTNPWGTMLSQPIKSYGSGSGLPGPAPSGPGPENLSQAAQQTKGGAQQGKGAAQAVQKFLKPGQGPGGAEGADAAGATGADAGAAASEGAAAETAGAAAEGAGAAGAAGAAAEEGGGGLFSLLALLFAAKGGKIEGDKTYHDLGHGDSHVGYLLDALADDEHGEHAAKALGHLTGGRAEDVRNAFRKVGGKVAKGYADAGEVDPDYYDTQFTRAPEPAPADEPPAPPPAPVVPEISPEEQARRTALDKEMQTDARLGVFHTPISPGNPPGKPDIYPPRPFGEAVTPRPIPEPEPVPDISGRTLYEKPIGPDMRNPRNFGLSTEPTTARGQRPVAPDVGESWTPYNQERADKLNRYAAYLQDQAPGLLQDWMRLPPAIEPASKRPTALDRLMKEHAAFGVLGTPKGMHTGVEELYPPRPFGVTPPPIPAKEPFPPPGQPTPRNVGLVQPTETTARGRHPIEPPPAKPMSFEEWTARDDLMQDLIRHGALRTSTTLTPGDVGQYPARPFGRPEEFGPPAPPSRRNVGLEQPPETMARGRLPVEPPPAGPFPPPGIPMPRGAGVTAAQEAARAQPAPLTPKEDIAAGQNALLDVLRGMRTGEQPRTDMQRLAVLPQIQPASGEGGLLDRMSRPGYFTPEAIWNRLTNQPPPPVGAPQAPAAVSPPAGQPGPSVEGVPPAPVKPIYYDQAGNPITTEKPGGKGAVTYDNATGQWVAKKGALGPVGETKLPEPGAEEIAPPKEGLPGKEGGPNAVSKNGVQYLKQSEKFEPEPYDDHGHKSIGYGTPALPDDEHITEEEASRRLEESTNRASQWIHKNIHTPLTQGRYDMLVSLHHNLKESDMNNLISDINKGDWQKTYDHIRLYNKALFPDGTKRVMNGLINRREHDIAIGEGHQAIEGVTRVPASLKQAQKDQVKEYEKAQTEEAKAQEKGETAEGMRAKRGLVQQIFGGEGGQGAGIGGIFGGGGWNPLLGITGPGKVKDSWNFLGLTDAQRQALMYAGLNMAGSSPLGWSAFSGAVPGLQAASQMQTEAQKRELAPMELAIKAAQVPKVGVYHQVDPITGQQQSFLYNVHTGEPIKGPGSEPGAGTAGAGGFNIPAHLHGQEALNAAPEHYRDELRGVVSGDIPISNYRAGPQREAWSNAARQVEPGWSPSKIAARVKYRDGLLNQTSTEGKMAHSLNAGTEHMGSLLGLDQMLPDHSAVWSRAAGWWKEQVGSDPYRGAWKTGALALADEIAKLQGGGTGAEAEKQRWLEKLSPDQPRAVRLANIAEAVDILNGHAHDMDRKYDAAVGQFGNPHEVMGPENRAVLQKARDRFSQATGGKKMPPEERGAAVATPAPITVESVKQALERAKREKPEAIPAILERARKAGIDTRALQ